MKCEHGSYNKYVSNLLDFFYPKKCLGCRKAGSYFCKDCQQTILQTDLVCPGCEKLSVGGQTHLVCRRRFGLDGLWSLGTYQDPLKTIIKKLKYSQVQQLAQYLADLIIEYWARYQPFLLEKIKKDNGADWLVVPVPLYWYRQNWRGFNQSSLIAKSLAKNLGLKYCEALKRIKHTSPQVKLKGTSRYHNVRNAFSLNTKYLIHNTNILLIDDVWTTGATLKECCFILKKAGAKQVWALTIAR